MFRTFFLTELKYTLKQPMVYLFLGIVSLLAFGATVSDNVIIGESIGNVFKNSPHSLTIWTSVMSIIGLLFATAFFNNAALRDYNNEFNEILFTTPLSKPGYFFGRFFGALILATIPLLGVFLGSFLGTILGPAFGWIDADRFGPFYLQTFVNNYFLFVLPNMFIAGSIIFALANLWKSTVISFVGAIIILMGYILSGSLLSDIDNETIGGLLDIFGSGTYDLYSKYYTPIEKNTISPGFSGLLLWNRLIWISVGLIVLGATYFAFSFQKKNKKVKAVKEPKKVANTNFDLPKLHPVYNNRTGWMQFRSFFSMNFRSIAKSVTFTILLIFGVIMLIANLSNNFEYFGLQSYPVTYKVIDVIDNLSNLFVIIILVFFSGELIWRDRDSKINEVIDSTAHTSIVSLSAKTLSLIAITAILHGTLVVCGIIYQLLKGYTVIELDVYLLDFLNSNLIYYASWSGVMIMIQVLLNNRYIGYFVSILAVFFWELILMSLDIESSMMLIGEGPTLSYSDMNGFGPGLYGAMWFAAYWLLFSFICLLFAGALWSRGITGSLKERLQVAFYKASKSYKTILSVTLLLWTTLTGFVYYNTQVLNVYQTSDEQEEMAAAYEKRYKKYEDANQPKISDIKYQVDIYPYERDVFVKASIQLVNENATSIDSIHFITNDDWETDIIIPNSNLGYEDEDLGYLIYILNEPMKPGDSINMEISTKYVSKGFENDRGSTAIVRNGTFLNNFEILPSFGYASDMEISDKNKRKKYNLPPKDRMPELQENCSAKCMSNYLSSGRSDFILAETTISTASDQTAIAPGSLIKQWTENGRNYYHYKVDHPSQNFYSFISAKYEIARRKWNGIDIEVYHDAKHTANVERMLDAVERSLDYYIKNFGPYYHKQCRIIEFPRYASFAQAFPGTMPYSEAIGFIIDLEDEKENNVVDAVIAHEMAHQWWAHQLIGADMQGGTMLSESFAEYSALMTMKGISKNAMKMREFLKYDHERYLRGRSGEVENELPLYKVENQGHIHYGKGSVILYALQDYIGEDKVNLAIREFLEEYRYRKPPYPTSLDFMKYLEPQVPDSLKYLITDWFKEITLYDNRMKDATYKQLANGKYEVTMNIESNKLKADTIGNETKVPIDDWIDIGVFSDDDEENLMYQKRVKINEPEMTFTFEVDSLPVKAAIDPRRLLIDRVYDDNIKKLVVE